jgi:hypothetical protein
MRILFLIKKGTLEEIKKKWKNIRSSYIPPNWDDRHNIADMNELDDIGLG